MWSYSKTYYGLIVALVICSSSISMLEAISFKKREEKSTYHYFVVCVKKIPKLAKLAATGFIFMFSLKLLVDRATVSIPQGYHLAVRPSSPLFDKIHFVLTHGCEGLAFILLLYKTGIICLNDLDEF